MIANKKLQELKSCKGENEWMDVIFDADLDEEKTEAVAGSMDDAAVFTDGSGIEYDYENKEWKLARFI